MHKTNQLFFCMTTLLHVLPLLLLSSSLSNAMQQSSRLDPTSEVLLELKRYREAEENPVYSNDWAVEVYGGEEVADEVAALHGFINMGKIGNLDDHYHFRLNINVTLPRSEEQLSTMNSKSLDQFSEIGLRGEISRALSNFPKVGFVEQQKLHRNYHKMYYNYTRPTDPKFYKQWSLLNTGSIAGSSGKDLNVEPAWMQGITGKGVVVSVFDNGLEWTHPDIRPNYDSLASYDYVHYDHNPTPDNYFGDKPDEHGTSCAGEIAMVKDNSRCGVGVAYESKIGAIKFNVSHTSDLTESYGLGYKNNYIQVYSNSWGPNDYGFVVKGPGTVTKRTLYNGATRGRNGKGVIYVFASGNGGRYYDSCAADGYAASIYTIAVGSANSYGRQADYDEQCASKMAVTFSYNSGTFPGTHSTWDPYNQVTTTTLLSGCTDGFTGTSASTPLVSGVVTLALQANPNLTWRDVQYLIAYTSNRDSLYGGEWSTNGAGLRVSHKFGFGAIDAEAMVTRAKRWINVPRQHSATVYPSTSYGTSRHYSPLTITFNIRNSTSGGIMFLEHIVVTISLRVRGYRHSYDYSDFVYELYSITDIDDLYNWLEASHPRRGDIKILLTSPQGTTSTLLPYRNYDYINAEGYSSWPFMSVHHWGENPVGRWTLTVYFKSSYGYVSVSGAHMSLYGTITTPQAVANIPSVCDSACTRYCSGTGPDHCDACRHLRVAATLQCVTSCPSGTTQHNRYCLGNVTQSTESPTTVSPTDVISTDPPTTNQPTSPHTTQSLPTTTEHKIPTYQPHTNPPSPPTTTERHIITFPTIPHTTSEEHHSTTQHSRFPMTDSTSEAPHTTAAGSTVSPTTVSQTDAISTDPRTTNQPTSPYTTQSLPTTTEHKIPTYQPHTNPPSPPTTTEQHVTPPTKPVMPHTTNEEHHFSTQHTPVTDSTSEATHSATEKAVTTTMHQTQSSEATTAMPQREPTTTDIDANANSALGGQHGPGVAVIAGVSIMVIVLVLLAAAVVTAVVVYLVKKKFAPQSKGFTKLSMINMETRNGVDV